MPYHLYIHNIYLDQYHDTKPISINLDWLLGLTPTVYAPSIVLPIFFFIIFPILAYKKIYFKNLYGLCQNHEFYMDYV